MTTLLSLAPRRFRLRGMKGNSLEYTFPVTEPDADPETLTGYTARAQFVGNESGTQTTATSSISTNNVIVSLTPTQTGNMDDWSEFEVRLTNEDASVVATVVYGNLHLIHSPIEGD